MLPTKRNIRRPVAEGYDAVLDYGSADIDTLFLQLVTSPNQPLNRATAPQENAVPFRGELQTDFRPESGSIFSRNSFTGGEGLDRAHKVGANTIDASRYWDSKGIEIFIPSPGDSERIRLLKTTEQAVSSAETTPYMHRRSDADTRVYWADVQDVKYVDDLTVTSPSATTEDPHAGQSAVDVLDLAVLGDLVYVALDASGIHERDTGGTWTHWSDVAATRVWGVKDRIVAAVGASLYEAGATDTSTLLKTLASGSTWTSVIDAGTVILAAASDGAVYAFSDEAGSLLLRGQTEMAAGEVPYALGYAQGLVFVGVGESTTNGVIGRLYIAQLSGAQLRGSQLIRQWGKGDPTVDHAPRSFLVTRDAVYTAVIEDGSETHVWKYHLATAGLSRHFVFAVSGLVYGMATIAGRFVASIAGNGIYRDHATDFVSTGYLITPAADFYTVADKSWVGLRLDSETLVNTGAAIALAYTTDPTLIESPADSGWKTGISITKTEGVQDDEFYIEEVTGRFIALRVTLTPSTVATATPNVRSISARGFIDLGDVVIEMPVNISDLVMRRGKRPLRVEGHGLEVYTKLLELEKQPVDLTILRVNEQIRGVIESVGAARLVTAPRGSTSMLTCMVRARGVRVG